MFGRDANSQSVGSVLRTLGAERPGNVLTKRSGIRSGHRAAGGRRLRKASWLQGTSPPEGAQDTEFPRAGRVRDSAQTTQKPVVSGEH